MHLFSALPLMMGLNALRDTLSADLRGNGERGNLVRSACVTAGLKVGATALGFAGSLLYARSLGPHDYGLVAYVLAWVSLLTIPASLGLPQYLMREGAKTPTALGWLCRWADSWTLLSGTVAGVLLACAMFFPAAAGARWLFVIAAPLPLLNNLGANRSALLRALGWVARSQWPGLVFARGLTLAVLAALWIWRGALDPAELIIVTVAAAAFALALNQRQLSAALSDAGSYRSSAEVRAALPFMWLGVLYLLNNRTDMIMLGSLNGAHAAGVYSVASGASEIIGFFLVTANMVIAPRIAYLYHEGRHVMLQRLLSGATRRILAFTIPIAVLFIVAAHPLLKHLYGTDYDQGAAALQILAAAQLINVAAGPTGHVLNMTGHEKLTAIAVALSALLNIVLNAVLIPLYGVNGAAIATGTSLVLLNGVLWYCIRTRLGLRPTALGV